jgi:protein dithiol oxidoreductase (disulfide-forming)
MTMDQNRRTLLLGASSLLALPLLAGAQDIKLQPRQQGQSSTDILRPYSDIGNFTDDRDRVFLFFSYGCSFCAQYASGIVQWGKSLPEPIQLVRIPVLTTEQVSQAAALAYYVVRDVAPNRLDELDALAYSAAGNTYTPEIFPEILRKMNLPASAVKATMNKQITKDRMVRSVLLSKRYKVTSTPHFGVGGRFATNANFTNGDYTTLVQLLNGLVSQVITAS